MEFEDASYERMQASTRLEADCFEDAKGAHGVVPTTYRSNSTHSMSSVASSKAQVAESPAGTEMNLGGAPRKALMDILVSCKGDKVF